MKKQFKSKLLSILLVLVMVLALVPMGAISAFAAERDREFPAITSGNALNMSISDNGVLTWDAVDGASGYKVYLKRGSYTVAIFDSATTSMALSLIDQTKADSGQYSLEVGAVGVFKSATMQYYYTSNVDKLEPPTKLQWLGNNVIWEYVDDTEVLGYTLYLYNFDGLVAKIDNATSPYDLSEYNPQNGWTFQVQAKGDRTLSSKRSSVIVESPAKGTRTKTISEVVTDNSLNMAISSKGTLTWDSVNGATGYKITLKQNGYNVATFDTNNTYYFIDTEMNSRKLDSGSYLVEVSAKGVSKNDTMTYFYTSHVDKMESPNGLQWLGYNAIWNEVEGATSYTVSLYNFSGLVTTVHVDGTLYNFEGSQPQDGWTFKVQANGGGTFNSKRDSIFTESPAFVAPTHNIAVNIINNSNNGEECGQVYLETNKVTVDWTSSGGFSKIATYGTSVTIKAKPNVGYEFSGWKLNDDWVSNELEYQFTANEDKTCYALFQAVDYYFVLQPTDHTVAKDGTINVEWTTNFTPSRTDIQYWDDENGIWDQWDVNTPSGTWDNYDFTYDQAESFKFRLVAFIDEQEVAVSEEFTISWVQPDIELFEATITAPVGGEYPSFELELANADMYSYRSLSWYDTVTGSKLSNSDTFIAGRKYRLNVIIEAKEGYQFTNDTVYKVNNVKAVGSSAFKDFYFIAAEPEVVTYDVIYNPGEGQGSVDLESYDAGTTITLKTPQELGFVALDGKMFDAWEINEIRYEPGDEYVINAYTMIKALWKNIPHTCVGVLQNGQDATCNENGWKDYYQCECGNYYADENCQTLINDIEAWKENDGKITAQHTGTASWVKTATTHEKK